MAKRRQSLRVKIHKWVVEEVLAHLPKPLRKRVVAECKKLGRNPFPREYEVLMLGNPARQNLYYVDRFGFRISYEVKETERLVTVMDIMTPVPSYP